MLRVEIRVEGQLDPNWTEWLGGLTVAHAEESETVLAGCVKDQAELYGLIAKLRDIGMKLISVQSTAVDEEGKTVPKQ
ncbi:hypothetical protein FBQ81_06155 [Chloroflexi bacterium CFX6]|nr:hypothetical protein [Chloroflexi bacterium CFX6]